MKQMTLGELIKRLSDMPVDLKMRGIGSPHSYRGYYCELAFQGENKKRTVNGVLADAMSCLGVEFEGYKGGMFLMTEDTPVWIANYSMTGEKIISINDDGTVDTIPDDY